jgi:hypothetical protein
MADRQWRERGQHDRQRGSMRDVSARKDENVRGRDYSGISYGYTGGHAEDQTVHHSPAGLEAGYMEYGRQSYGGPYGAQRFGAREWSSPERWRVPGPHAGRGPRGYHRSDERILEELNDRLTAHGLIDASDVDTRVENGEITLEGFVDSRAAKRAAEDLAEDIPGVRDVHNRLRLRSHVPGEGVGRTSVLGLTEGRTQTNSRMPATGTTRRSRTRT